jgi:hypothetical protein
MNAAVPPAAMPARLMSGAEYRDSLRRYRPVVYVDGRRIDIGRRRPGSCSPASTRWR